MLSLLVLCWISLQAWADPAPTPQAAKDIKDTHQRLDRIYRELGLRREAISSGEGCRCLGPRMHPNHQPATAPRSMPPVLGYLLIAIVLALILVPFLYALRNHLRRSKSGAIAEEEEDLLDEQQTPRRDAAPWLVDLEQCRTLAQEGQLAQAYASLHRLVLQRLHEANALTLDGVTTNWGYIRRLYGAPQQQEILTRVTLAAEQAVLGQHPPPVEHYWQLEQQVVALAESQAGT